MEFIKQKITPAIAKKYLESNTINRRVKNRKVKAYSIEMLAGRWKENTAETIKISKQGNVLDGQHRLLAVVMANTPVGFHVATGLDESVFDVLDTGSVRNSNDSFKVAGIKNDAILPSIISFYMLLKDGRRRGKVNEDLKPTNTVILEEYYNDENFWQYVAATTMKWYVSFAKILPPSTIGGMYAYLYHINKEEAGSFMNQLCTGFDVKNKTVSLLRNKLTQDRLSTLKMPMNYRYAMILKAWNSVRKNNELKILKFDPAKEEFPIAC